MIEKSNIENEKTHQGSWYDSIRFSRLPKMASKVLSSLKKTITNIVTQLGIMNQGNLSLYGVFLLIFTATDGIRLHNLLTNKGRYAEKNVSSFKRIKTMTYIALSRLLTIAMLAVRLLAATGIAAICAPVPMALMAVRILERVVRYSHSLGRAFMRQGALTSNNPDYGEQKKAINYKIKNGLVKLGFALLGGAILATSIALTGPAAPLITVALWVAWGISDAVYNAIIKPKMKDNVDPDSAQLNQYIELKTIHSSQFDSTPIEVTESEARDISVTENNKSHERTRQPSIRAIRSARCSG